MLSYFSSSTVHGKSIDLMCLLKKMHSQYNISVSYCNFKYILLIEHCESIYLICILEKLHSSYNITESYFTEHGESIYTFL